jgi:hypothetical protein
MLPANPAALSADQEEESALADLFADAKGG